MLKVFLFLLFSLSSVEAEARTVSSQSPYPKTVSLWAEAMTQLSPKSESWIWGIKKDRLHRNGMRDSILMVSENASYEHVSLIVWLHGCNGFGKRTFSTRLMPQLKRLDEKGASYAIAIPEMPWSTNTRTKCRRQGAVFKSSGEFENYVFNVKERLNLWSKKKSGKKINNLRLIIVGHSAGGSAIMSIAREGGLNRLKPDAIVWSDSSYGSWLSTFWERSGKMLPRNTEVHIISRIGDKPHINALRLEEKIKKRGDTRPSGPKVFFRHMRRSQYLHRDIGDNVLSLTDLVPFGC